MFAVHLSYFMTLPHLPWELRRSVVWELLGMLGTVVTEGQDSKALAGIMIVCTSLAEYFTNIDSFPVVTSPLPRYGSLGTESDSLSQGQARIRPLSFLL